MNKQIKPLPILQGKTAFAINLISQVSVIVAQMVISLFLTPIVLDKMGAEAYGFVALLFQVTSWHRKKSTYTQWSQSHPMHRAPAPARHRPLGRSRFHNTPALQSHR